MSQSNMWHPILKLWLALPKKKINSKLLTVHTRSYMSCCLLPLTLISYDSLSSTAARLVVLLGPALHASQTSAWFAHSLYLSHFSDVTKGLS